MEIKPAQYYNNPQLAVKLSSVPHKMLPWGRGTGKTTIFGDEMLTYISYMPRCKIAFGGLTYYHIRTKSMPQIIDQLERRGIYRNIHYFVGHKSPKKYGWDEPYAPPLDYSACCHFWNGSVIEFISFDRPEMARSGSYDGLFFDEVAKLKKKAIDSDVMPTNRGNKERFGHLRFHHGTVFATTMPLTPDGEWIFDYENLMKENPKEYLYLEASAIENVHVLGDKYFRDLKRALPDVIYQVEVENQRFNFNLISFYPSLSEKHLYYDSYDYLFYDSINYDVAKLGSIDSRGDKDCIKDSPLYISMDFGSRINCMVICQEILSINEFRIIKNFYIENDVFQVIIKQFIDYYKYHKDKTIYLYGGSDGMKKTNASSNESYFDIVINLLVTAGWKVHLQAKFIEILHQDKYLFYNLSLREDNNNIPKLRINQNNANETFISMRDAPIKSDEIKKDKRSERNENLPQWKSTHLSDAVDNIYYWLYSHYITDDRYDTQDALIL
jgi:hypothetical protein